MSTKQPHSKSQTTLFQNWGYYGDHAKKVERREPEEPIVIEDDLDEVDEATLLAACERAEGELQTNQNTSGNPHPIPEATPLESLPGFDVSAGRLWIYPTNYPVRDYQFNIVGQALKKNTLVTLPTGLGKTFIAAVVMYNYYRWYPQGKVVFMAPTKPLVAQQIEACFNIMGIPESDMAEMTGSMPPSERKKTWKAKRIFFLTPQVLTNDLSRQACPAVEVKCLVVDEAHKALGNHAYCEVVRELSKYTPNFRVLALSATPGGDLKAVQQVINNLLISHVEIRSEDSIDIQRYAHERKVEKMVVPLGEELRHLQKKYLEMLRVYINRLSTAGAIFNKDPALLSKFQLLKAREAFRQDPPPQAQNRGAVEGDFAISMSLYHGYELLMQHGTRTLYNFLSSTVDGEKGFSRTRQELMRNGEFINIMNILREKFDYGESGGNVSLLGTPSSVSPSRSFSCTQKSKKFVVSHPKMQKLQEVVIQHFKDYQNNFRAEPSTSGTAVDSPGDTRVMIFAQYRDSVQEIAEMLNCHQPLVRCMAFVGQSSAGKATKGISQKEQLRVVKEFKCGNYNTLVSTCVGEEGLDIGDVDLIVCYDAHKSPTRLVQRMGRTGRKRSGRIVMLMTEGKEASVYDKSQYSRRGIHKALQGNSKSLQLFPGSPRMIPRGLEPQPHKMYITSEKYVGKQKKRKGAGKKTSGGPITPFLKNDRKVNKMENAYLTDEERRDWMANFRVGDTPVPTLPGRRAFLSLGGVKEVPRCPELSLSSWSLWQAKEQTTHLVSHSKRSRDFVRLMEFMEIQDQIDGDDIYGMEMALHLKDEDVMKPTDGKGIEKYCQKTKKKISKARREEEINTVIPEGEPSDADQEQVVKKRGKKRRKALPVLISDDSGDDFLDTSGGTLPHIPIDDNGEDKGGRGLDREDMPTVLGECNSPSGKEELGVNPGGKTLPAVSSDPLEVGEETSRAKAGSLHNENEGQAVAGACVSSAGLGGTEDEPRLLGGEVVANGVDSNIHPFRKPAPSVEFVRPGLRAPLDIECSSRVEGRTGTDHNTDHGTVSEPQRAESTASSGNEVAPAKQKEKLKKLKKSRKKEEPVVDDDAFEENPTERTSTSPSLTKSSALPDTKKLPESPRYPPEGARKDEKSPKHINDLLALLKSHRKDTKRETKDTGGDRKLPDDNEGSVIGMDAANVDHTDEAIEDLSHIFPCSQFSFSHQSTVRGNIAGRELPPSPPSVSSLDILDDIELSFGTPGRKIVCGVLNPRTPGESVLKHQKRLLSVTPSVEGVVDMVSDSLGLQKTPHDGGMDPSTKVNSSSPSGRVKIIADGQTVSSPNHSATKNEENGDDASGHRSLGGVQSTHHGHCVSSEVGPARVGTDVRVADRQQPCGGEPAGADGGTNLAGAGNIDASGAPDLVGSGEGQVRDSLSVSDLQGFDDWDDTNDVPDIADVETPEGKKRTSPGTGGKPSPSTPCVRGSLTSMKRKLLKNGRKLSVSSSFVKVGEADNFTFGQFDQSAENKKTDDTSEIIRKPDKSENVLLDDDNFILSTFQDACCVQSEVEVNFDLNFDLDTLDDVTDGDDGWGDASAQEMCVQRDMCNMTETSSVVGAPPHTKPPHRGWVESFALDESLLPPKAESTPLAVKGIFHRPKAGLELTPVLTVQPNSGMRNSAMVSEKSAKWARRKHYTEDDQCNASPLPRGKGLSKRTMSVQFRQPTDVNSKLGETSDSDDVGSNLSMTSASGPFLKKLSFCSKTKASPLLDSKKRKSTPLSLESVSKKRRSQLMDSLPPLVKEVGQKYPDDGTDGKGLQTFNPPPRSGDTERGSDLQQIGGICASNANSLERSPETGNPNRTSRLVEPWMKGMGADGGELSGGDLRGDEVSQRKGEPDLMPFPEVHHKKRRSKPLASPALSSDEVEEVMSAPNDGGCNMDRSKRDLQHMPEPQRTKRGSMPLDSPATNSEDEVICLNREDNVQTIGNTQEFDIEQAGNARSRSPAVLIVSEEEVLSQIPRASKRCRNVLRSPDDPSPRSEEKIMKKRRGKKKVLQSSSDEDEVTPVRRPPSRKRRLLISPPSMIPSLDSDFEDPTPQKLRQSTKKVGFAKQAKNKLDKGKSARKIFSEGAKGFLDEEAELSDREGVSSDEAEDSMLDHSLDGFINNATQLTQQSPSGAEDMHAVYMKSIRSPAGNAVLHPGRNRFKMSRGIVADDNIFSQAPQPDESYADDSFCVEGVDASAVNPGDVSYGDLENTINVGNIIGGTGCKRLRNRAGGESRAARILRLGRKAVLKSDSTDESESEIDITAQKLEPPKKFPKGRRGRVRRSCKRDSAPNTNSSSDNGGKFAGCRDQHLPSSSQQCQKNRASDECQNKGSIQTRDKVLQSRPKGIQIEKKFEKGSHKLSVSDPRENVKSTDATKHTECESRDASNHSAGNRRVQAQDEGEERLPFGDIGLNFDLGFGGVDPFSSDTEEGPLQADPSKLFRGSVRESSALTKEQRQREERLRRQKEKQEEFRKKMAAKRKTTQGGDRDDSQGFDVNSSNGGGISSDVASTKLNLPTRGPSHILPKPSKNPVVLISSKELSSSPSMVSTLAIKHGVEPRVCQLRGCDFMVSSRMGVERRTLSDFAHGSNRTKLVERVKEMGVLFDKICVIVEKDRPKRDEKTKPFTRSKYFDSTLAALARTSVKLLFSDSTDDTSIILADLAKVEARKSFGILYPEELTEEQEQVRCFCRSLPGVNFALSLSMMLRFPSLSEIITCTESTLQLHTGITQERARGIVEYLRHQFDEQMMGTPRRK